MKCPVCGTANLVGRELESGLLASGCSDCGGNYGGVWFDGEEWESLKSRNLHDDVHFIFGQPWQAEVTKRARERAHEEILRVRFGGEDLSELRRIKVWLEGHPNKDAMLAFLLHPEDT